MPYTEFHYTPTGTGVISGKEVLEQTEDAINDLGGQISGDVQTAIDTANNALNTANTASADAQNAINTANTAYTAATNAQNTANTAQNTASNALTAAQNAQNDVNALGKRVTTAEGNITQNTNAITGLTTHMGTAEGNITTLQNDVITAQGTATSAQNTATLARGQAYVVRYASVAVSDNSTVPYTDLNNVDNVKVNDLLLDINGKLYQITSVDTSNETVSVTTPLTQLAVDSDVVHKSGDETVGGIKTFNDTAILRGSYLGNEPSTSFRTCAEFLSRFDTKDKSGIFLTKFRSSATQGALSGSDSVFITLDVLENGERTNAVLRFNLSNWNGNTPGTFSLYPKSGITSNLGMTANKWTKINGINPGALSMPDLDNGIDISSYITVNGGNKESLYTPPVNGWISVALTRTSGSVAVMLKQGNIASSGHKVEQENGSATCNAMLPVKGGVQVSINSAMANGIDFAYFYPCQGNV